MGFAYPNLSTHAPRWEIHESALAIPHEEIRITMDDGRKLVGLVRPLAQRRGRAGQPRLRRQPRPPAPPRADARAPRLRRARARQPGQRREPGPLQRPRRQRPAGARRRPRLPHAAPRRRPRQDRGLRPVARRRGPARGGVARPAPGRRRLRRRRPPDGRQRGDGREPCRRARWSGSACSRCAPSPA